MQCANPIKGKSIFINGLSILNDALVTIKFLNQKSPKIVELEPANDDFQNIIVDLEHEDFTIEGKSVGLLRRN